MAIAPLRLVHRGQLDAEIKKAASGLGPDVVRLVYSLGEDHTGDPALFFRIVLTDEAAQEERLIDVTNRIANVLIDAVQPIENWGLYPYFNFRSLSETQRRPDADWSA